MIYTKETVETNINALNNKIGNLLSSYTQALNNEYGWTGSLFQASTKAKALIGKDRQYPRTCFHYIHQNPLRANLAETLSQWEFSSYKEYAGLRNGTLPAKDFTYKWLNINDPKSFIKASQESIDPKIIENFY